MAGGDGICDLVGVPAQQQATARAQDRRQSLQGALLLVGIPAVLTCAGTELARHVPMGGTGRSRTAVDRARAAGPAKGSPGP